MNTKFNVLYPREYRTREGAPIQTQWIQCGVAWQNERGLDVKLWVVPPASLDPLSGMCVRLKLREPTPDETARAAGRTAGGAGADPDGAPPMRAYEMQGGQETARRRPEHRDGLDPQGQLRGVPNGRSEPRDG